MSDNQFVRKTHPVTKERAKALVASGLHRAVVKAEGIDKIAQAAGCSRRCIEKALSHDTLPSLETLVNILDSDANVLDELFASKGFRLVPNDMELSPDMTTVSQMSRAVSSFIGALEDGKRDHRETLELAHLLRPLIPRLSAIVHEADGLRSVA